MDSFLSHALIQDHMFFFLISGVLLHFLHSFGILEVVINEFLVFVRGLTNHENSYGRPEGGELGSRKRSSSSSRNSTETTKGTEPLAFENKPFHLTIQRLLFRYRYLLDPNKIGKIRLGESSDLCSSSTRSCFGCRNILVIANLYSLYIYIFYNR